MKITFMLKRLGAGGLALLIGFQSVLADSVEKNYWDQRRADQSARRSGTLVSRAVSPNSSLPWADQLPAVQAYRPALSPSLERSVPKPFLEKHRALLTALSSVYGTVRKVTPAPRSSTDRVVIHIQDVHQNAEAQLNIRGAVADLLKSGRVDVVALEGSTEPIDLQAFVDFPHRKPVELAADWLLKENKISGPIHAALTFQGRLPRLVGVDDEKHYAANVQAVRDSAGKAGGVRLAIETSRQKMEADKSLVFSANLSALDKTVNDYRAERIPLGAYVETMMASASAGGQAFRSVEMFLRALKIERSLDFQQVERERKQLIEKLTQTLTASEIDALLAESAAYRSGGRLFGEFYAGLTDLCRRKGVALSAFPAMDEYVRYALLADGIQSEQLLTEIGLLEKAAYDVVVRTPEERALVDRSRRLWLASRLVDFALTSPEWEEWGKAKGEFDLDSFEAFYREAQARDKAIAENVGNALAESNLAVLVTGGFHAEGVARLLEQRGVSVISFVPKLTKVDLAQGSSYLSVFSQEKTPLEKLFQGEKLFLSTNPIPKETRLIQLPVVVTLLGMLLAAQIDPQLTYTLLGGLGQIKDVVGGAGMAQALVVVGAGALVFRVFNKEGKVQVESSPERPGFVTTFKIKFWDPVREQVLYFFPAVILVPSLLTLLVTTTFGGGVGMALATFLVVSGVGVFGVVVILLGLEHKGYTQAQKVALVGPALKIGVLTMTGFVVSMLVLSPSVWGLVAYTDQFFSWMPAGEGKAFFLSALVGNLLGVWKHFDHNEKTFENFLQWLNNNTIDALLPLSRTAAKKKPFVAPAFSRVKLNIPDGTTPNELLIQWYNDILGLLKSRVVTEQDLANLVEKIKEINPAFYRENIPLLTDTRRLHKNPSLVKQIVNVAVFLPLGAHSLGFDGHTVGGVPLNQQSWSGYSYLGEQIWLVEPRQGTLYTSLRADFGFGIMPTVDYGAIGEKMVWASSIKKPNLMKPFEVSAMNEWAVVMGQAAKVRYRGILLQLLKDNVFARRVSRTGDYNPTPLNQEIRDSIIRKDRGNPWDKYSAEASLYVNAGLTGLIDALTYLRDSPDPVQPNKKNHHLGIVFFKSELDEYLASPSDNYGRRDALRQVTVGIIEQIGPVRDLMLRGNSIAALEAAIKLLITIQGRLFFRFEDRYLTVTGKNLKQWDRELPSVSKAYSELSIIPGKFITPPQTKMGDANSVDYREAGVGPSDAGEKGIDESTVPGEDKSSAISDDGQDPHPLGEASVVPFFPETENSLDGLMNAILSIRWIQSGTGSSDEGIRVQLIKFQDRLVGKVVGSENVAASMLECAAALELGSDEIGFLKKYVEIQRTGALPSIYILSDGVFNGDENKALEVHERLVNLLGNGDYLPLSFDEGVGEIFDTESSEGGLAPFYEKGYRVVVFKDHYDENVAKNNLVQKAIVNVVRNLIDFQETASPGQGRIVRDSRGGLSQRGVHKKKSSGQKVFVKFMGEKTLVVLWVDAENEAHGRQSFTANKEVDRRIASQVDNLQKELEKYVVVGSNFSVDETANLSELLTLSQSGNGVGPFGTKANSLLYLRSGRVGRGIGGAGVEAMLLLLGASVLGGVGMGFFVLPLFSLAHVWVIARQNHGMSVAQRVRQFLWHWFMAMPYALIGLSGVQEILGGENAAQLFAVAWHLGTDIVFMAQDQISARKAARDTMDMLLPPAGPLLIEQVGGARWGLGLSLFWILLAYPDLSSSELVAGLVVGALTSNGSSSHIKFIGDDEPLDPAHDGEKAYHLGVLARLGVNVPPGFALQPSFYINDYQRTKSLSNVMADVLVALKRLEEKTGQVFGNEQNPLFLSVRSNAGEEESMPGLMKTIINVGLNQATLRGLVERDGEWFAQDTLRRFIRSYATAVYDISDEEFYLASTELLLKYKVGEERLLPAEGLARLVDNYRSIVREHGREIPEDVNEQLKESLEAVLKSFDTGGAQIFKEVRGLSNAGMGAIVQKVVFGNLDDRSGAGVVFTRNRRTGENSLDGQFGNRIQGEDLVSGFQSTGMKDALLLKAEMPHVYDSLLHIKSLVENKFGWPQDIEFTIQKGELFILQTRRAALSPEAFLQAGEDMVNEGIIPTNVFITRQAVEMGKLKELFHLRPGINAEVIMRGTTGTPGAQRGRMMFSDRFDPFHPPEDPVIVVDPNPDAQNLLRILFSPHVSGLITFEGPRTSHARTRCQSSDMASVMGIEGISRDGNDILLSNGVRIQEGVWIVVDGDRRRVLLTEETDVLERSKLIRDASLRMDEVQGIEEQVQRQWRGALYEEVLEEYVVAAQDLERIKEKFPTISRSELDTANVRLHTLHLIAWEKGAEQGISRERVNRDFVAMKQMILKSIVAEEALRKGEVSIMLLEDSSTDRSGSKCLDPMHAELLFGDTLAKNRERAERIRQEKYPEYPSKERLLRAETRHHDGGGVRFFTHLIYVNVPSGRVGAETKQDLVVAQNLKYQEIIGNLGAGSPTIRYDEAQRQPINMYQADTIQLHWRPNTDSNNTSRLSLVINSPTNGDLTLSETGTSTTIVFSNETVAEIPYQCLRSLFKVNDSVYLVVSPELSRLLDNHGIPRVFTKGRGRDLTSVRIVSSTVAPAIKKNIQGRAVQDYIEKDLSALQEFKKDYWDPLVSTLTGDQLHALIKLIFYYEVRTCFQKMPPFLLLNHDVFRQMVPEMSQDRWEDQLYLDGIIRQLLQAIKLDNTEIDSLLVQFNDSSVIPPALDNVSYSSFLQMFRAFARAGAILPNKLRDMLNFLERRKYSSPWDENGLFRVAAGLLPEEKKPDPPSTEPDDPPPPPQNPDLGPGDVAKTDAIVVANLLREATKDNNKPLLLEALLPTNQPLQALLGNTRGGAAQQETVFDRIKKFQTDPAYTVPFKEALKSALGDTGILAGTDLGHQQAGVISLNRDNHSSVQAEIQLRGTLNTLFEGLGLRDQAQPLYRTIVIPTSDEAVKLVDQLGAKTFPGTYVAIPQFGPGETLTVPKLVKACEELIAKGWIVPATVLVPLNKMENLDSASLTNTYLTPLENKLKTLAVTAKDLPELKRVTQEIKSFLDLLKTVAEMA